MAHHARRGGEDRAALETLTDAHDRLLRWNAATVRDSQHTTPDLQVHALMLMRIITDVMTGSWAAQVCEATELGAPKKHRIALQDLYTDTSQMGKFVCLMMRSGSILGPHNGHADCVYRSGSSHGSVRLKMRPPMNFGVCNWACPWLGGASFGSLCCQKKESRVIAFVMFGGG